jgi:hypothetical protein
LTLVGKFEKIIIVMFLETLEKTEIAFIPSPLRGEG